MKKELRIHLTDFWTTFALKNNFFVNLLSTKYKLIYDSRTPQFLIHCRYGSDHKRYSSKITTKLYWTADPAGWLNVNKGSTSSDYGVYDYPVRPHFSVSNYYAATNELDNNHPNHYFLPFYVFMAYCHHDNLINSHIDPPDWTTKKDISFVYSNPKPTHRNKYFEVLSKHFKINSGGKHLTNINNEHINKIEFLRQHAYDLSIENCFEYGYSTEKILEPIIAQTIPIYWGYTPKHINPDRYIQASPDPEDIVRHIHYLNNNPHIAQEILRQPAFKKPDAIINEINNFSNFLFNIVETILS